MPERHELAHALRFISIDAVQKANSGHPGMPMGMADIAEVLWNDFLKHNPQDPQWLNRDRFVLSNGHGSMLLYALLHLTGYDLRLDDLKAFRSLHSKTPGHPEWGITPGVETTTGPLGQGLANAVGMALAEKLLAGQFNREHFNIIDHHTYCFVGDGCLMEGISHEVCSFAGTLGLGKLIVFWDDNGISIDGAVKAWWNDDTAQRFAAYGWQVITTDGHEPAAINQAIRQAKAETQRPTLICCKTKIGFGAPTVSGTAQCHGSPLGQAEIAATRLALNWPYQPFEIPVEIYQAWDASLKGKNLQAAWQQQWAAYQLEHPDLAASLQRRLAKQLPLTCIETLRKLAQDWQQQSPVMATRKASQLVLDSIQGQLPELLGGSADLSESNATLSSRSQPISRKHWTGNYLHYGVREFGMSAMMNGIVLYGGFRPFGATFLTFLDYARNAVRMSALMKQPVIYIYSHDSIGLGEDGPTHQPIEHLTILRVTPGMSVWRPCDAVETAVAWLKALENISGPTSLILSRQNLEHQPRNLQQLANIERGGYVLLDSENPEAILLATGSELGLAIKAAQLLIQEGWRIRVVSMPSLDVFQKQDQDYRESVLPRAITRRVAIEAAATDYWYRWVGLEGAVIGIDRYGESAPASKIYEYLGFNVAHIRSVVLKLLQN